MKSIVIKNCPICNFNKFIIRFRYKKKPFYETDFGINPYKRNYYECKNCNHWTSDFLISDKFYKNFYAKQTYKNNYSHKFSKIIRLKKKSDNYLRSNRISNFLKETNIKKSTILDVGSGLGVFPYEMKKRGFNISALDPDKKMSIFIKKYIKVQCYHADFINFKNNKKFNLITFNKVLEHVEDPKKFLKKAKHNLLRKNNFLYIEVPDTNAAKKISKNREEFFIEHINSFSVKSLITLLENCDYEILEFQRIKEPSGKLTMYTFARLKN